MARGTIPGRHRSALRPLIEPLEPRLTPSLYSGTYVWSAKGDGSTWNDPNNWLHVDPTLGYAVVGTPTPYSDVFFPPIAKLPIGSPATINFNSSYINFPIDSLTIGDSYTFQGNPIEIRDELEVTNPFAGVSNATILLGGLTLDSGATIETARGSTLNLANAADPTGLQIVLLGGLTASGGGQVVIDTQSITYPGSGPFSPMPLAIDGGTVTLGVNLNLGGINVAINSGASLQVADNVAATIGALTGSGLVDLAGTTAQGDKTGLTVTVAAAQSVQFDGVIEGLGQLTKTGNGTLTTGTIDFSDAGSIVVLLGSLDVDGSISAGTLQVDTFATLGGVGSWQFSGAVVFQAGSTFDITLGGTAAGTQYTQLVDTDAAAGIDLGLSTLTGSAGFEYQQGDQFTIASAPLIQHVFQNVVNGLVLLAGNVPFQVTYSNTAVTLTALQSVTTTRLAGSSNPSNPGQPVTFTATVSTRTAPVTTGTVSFEQGSTVLATVPLDGAGTARFTTASLTLGNTPITAVFNGATGDLGSTSAAWTQSVVPYATSTSLASDPNPILPGQPVTLIATVSAGGMPVTTGTVSFTRGSQYLGTVPVDPDGTAQLTTSSLSPGKIRLRAIYNGTPENQSSLSPVLTQSVVPFPTMTSLTLVSQIRPGGGLRYLLEATVTAVSTTGPVPVGTVVFRRNGGVIGRARLAGGTAILAIGRHAPSRGTFVASFQGSSRFRPSTSAPLKFPG